MFGFVKDRSFLTGVAIGVTIGVGLLVCGGFFCISTPSLVKKETRDAQKAKGDSLSSKKRKQETDTKELTTEPQIRVGRDVQRLLEGGKFGEVRKKKDKT